VVDLDVDGLREGERKSSSDNGAKAATSTRWLVRQAAMSSSGLILERYRRPGSHRAAGLVDRPEACPDRRVDALI
jgi:hypothetical protein